MPWAAQKGKWDHRGQDHGGKISIPVTTASAASVDGTTKIYEGFGLVIAAVGTTGYPKLLGSTLAAADHFAGIAAEDCEWTLAQSGVYVKTWTRGIFRMALAGAIATHMFKVCYADSAANPWTVKITRDSNAVGVGIIVGIPDTTNVWVKIDGFAAGFGGVSAHSTA
jgi:hypothetical protein